MKYRFFKKGAFENLDKYEARLNEEASQGWRVVNILILSGSYVALLERINKEQFY